MNHTILAYIKFLLNSTNKHGVHSPFVYKFILSLKKNQSKFDRLFGEIRHSLSTNKKLIKVTDYGAGSKKFKDDKRIVSEIAKNAGISKKRARLLYATVLYFNPTYVLEIGTSLGLATSSISLANPKSKIYTLEGCKETAKVAKNQFTNFQLSNIEIIVGNFKHTYKTILDSKPFDLIYFDGNHQKEATINYFELALRNVKNDNIFIFDDIHWSKDMEEAWAYIKNHKKVTLTIDTFQWGIVFFRKEQDKEHFIIRV